MRFGGSAQQNALLKLFSTAAFKRPEVCWKPSRGSWLTERTLLQQCTCTLKEVSLFSIAAAIIPVKQMSIPDISAQTMRRFNSVAYKCGAVLALLSQKLRWLQKVLTPTIGLSASLLHALMIIYSVSWQALIRLTCKAAFSGARSSLPHIKQVRILVQSFNNL